MKQHAETLVILTPAFPANESETNWVPSQQLLVKHLKQQFPQVNIVVLSFLYPYEVKEYKWNNVTVFSFDGMKRRKLQRLVLWMQIWRRLKQTKRSNKLIGVFSFWCGECALVGRYFSKWHRLPFYCWVCGMDARSSNKMVRYIRPSQYQLVAISDSIAQEFYKNHGLRPAHRVTNAIDTSMFTGVVPKKSIDVMAAGSFTAFKQYDVFLRVVQKLKQRIPSIRVVHCGTGSPDEIATIQTLAKELQVDSTIEFLGLLPHDEVIAYMQCSKIFLHPSSYEGFSTACLEALYAGAHVISFQRPMRYRIQHWHVVNNENEMLEKTFALLRNPNLDDTPVLVHSMSQAAKDVMKLFRDSADA
jgi:glycosyltransferase involved in cell wall biosynthesis